jgi:UDP-N-acetyl-D-mannosaminuronate dehydrogenase
MKSSSKVVVVGLGEVGKPLYELLSNHYDVIGVDISPVDSLDPVDVMHVCYPFQIRDFIGETERYIELFKPAITVINSTVAIGTTRMIAERTGAAVANSPVRGKHARMLKELGIYAKFVGAMDPETGRRVAKHFESAGLKTKVLSSPEATELAKLTETTYFGLLIAWAQEIERYCDQSGAKYDEIVSIYDEIAYLPSVKFLPGIIGGHCVMPNIEILAKYSQSELLDMIRSSNSMKIEREARASLARKAEAVAVGAV